MCMTNNKNDHVSIITTNRVDHGPVVNEQTSMIYVFKYDQDLKERCRCHVSCHPRQGDTRGSRQGDGTRSAR